MRLVSAGVVGSASGVRLAWLYDAVARPYVPMSVEPLPYPRRLGTQSVSLTEFRRIFTPRKSSPSIGTSTVDFTFSAEGTLNACVQSTSAKVIADVIVDLAGEQVAQQGTSDCALASPCGFVGR